MLGGYHDVHDFCVPKQRLPMYGFVFCLLRFVGCDVRFQICVNGFQILWVRMFTYFDRLAGCVCVCVSVSLLQAEEVEYSTILVEVMLVGSVFRFFFYANLAWNITFGPVCIEAA